MLFKFFALAGLTSVATAQSLIEALNSSSQLSNLTSLVNQFGLGPTLASLTNVTILAPDNAAIAQFLSSLNASGTVPTPDAVTALLQYHVLNGTHQNFTATPMFMPTNLVNTSYTNVTGGQRVEVRNTTIFSGLRDNSTIVGAAVNYTGGVVHVIDRVLTVPTSVSATARDFNLTSFYGALNATGLLNTVNGLGEVTIFAPNNAAFQRIGSGLANLTTEQAQSILQYHIVNGTVGYSTLLSNMTAGTLEGNNVTITVRNSSVFVNNAKVVIPNILVAGGVVHVIDEVLNPQNTTAATGTQTAGQPAYSGASSATNEPYTSGQPTPTTTINTSSAAAGATGGSSSSSSGGAWMPAPTAAVGAALGGLALLMQL